jgi:hypothetical protein
MIYLKIRFLTFIVVCFACLCGCTYPPILNDRSVTNSINSKYHFDAINLTSKKTWNSHGSHTVLTIQFVNGINIPSDSDTSKVTLAWHLGKQVFKVLKYRKLYDSCTVDFDTRKIHGDTTDNSDYACTFTTAQMEKK